MKITNFEKLLETVKNQSVKKVVAANAIDANTLKSLEKAVKAGFISAVLTGNSSKITETCESLQIDLENFEIKHSENDIEAAEIAAKCICDGTAGLLMKGLVSTDKFMKVILRKEYGLVPENGMLSHISLMESPGYHKLLLFTDAGIVPYPDLQKKIVMTEYLIKTAHLLGIEKPKIAVISPTEQILISLQSCTDGAVIAKMAERGQIRGAVIDGPMALDVAINMDSASVKEYSSQVAGDADALLFHNIDAANVFYKTNSKLCGARMAGFIAGARVPVIVSSRGDSMENKFYSIALASCLSSE